MLHSYLFFKVFFHLYSQSTQLRTQYIDSNFFNLNVKNSSWSLSKNLRSCVVGLGVMRISSSVLGKQENKLQT